MSLQTDYPAYWSAVTADSGPRAVTFTQLYQAGNISGAFAQLDLINRDYFLIGIAAWIPYPAYTPPANYAALPPLAIAPSVPLPPSLTSVQLACITVGGVEPAPLPTPLPPPAVPVSPAPAPSTPKIADGQAFYDMQSYCEVYPDDPLCGYDGTVGGGGSTTVIDNTTIVNEGLSATDVSGIVDGSLAGVWQADVAAVDAVVAAVVADIQGALTALGNALKAAYAVLSRLAGFMLNLLKTLLLDVVQGLEAAVKGIVAAIGDLYDNVIKPMLQGIQAIRQWIIGIYQQFIRPLLIILQDVRKVLAILSLFHVKFAAKLDTALADIQARITQPLFYLLGYVNAVANWINLIVTLNYLLQKPLFLNSLQAYAGSSINLQLNAMTQPTSAAGLAALQAAPKVPTPAETSADLSQFMATGTGNYAAAIAQNEIYIPVYTSGLVYAPAPGSAAEGQPEV